jgi:hypothetical protein
MPDSVANRESAIAWQLRGAWASRRAVVITLDAERTIVARVEGYVEYVSPTGATAEVDDLDGDRITVPTSVVRSVRKPHFHEPHDARAAAAPPRTPRDLAPPGDQLAFDFPDTDAR